MTRNHIHRLALAAGVLLALLLAGCLRRAPRVPDVLPKLHFACTTRADCAEGQQCVKWQYGIDPEKVRSTCELPCQVKDKAASCPEGLQCRVATDYGYGPPPVCFGVGYEEWPY